MGILDGDAADKAPRGRRKAGRAPGRRPLTEGNADDTRRDILVHAAHLFSRRGYPAVSLDDIAAAAGVTRATLYYHFRGKGDLFVETVLETALFVREAIGHIVAQRQFTVPQRIRMLIDAWREGPHFDDSLVALAEASGEGTDEFMLDEALPHLTPRQQARVREAFAGAHDVIQGLMGEGVERGELRPIPPAVLAYLFWETFKPPRYPKGEGLNRRVVENHLVDILLRGISTDPAG